MTSRNSQARVRLDDSDSSSGRKRLKGLNAHGLDRAKGQAYIAPLFASLAQRALRPDVTSFAALSTEFATIGGLNEQVLSDFETKGGREALAAALKRVLARIEGA